MSTSARIGDHYEKVNQIHFGKIFQFDYDGRLIKSYLRVYDIVTSCKADDYLYNFEKSSNPSLIPTKYGVSFCGMNLITPYDQFSWKNNDIFWFNKLICSLYSSICGRKALLKFKKQNANGSQSQFEAAIAKNIKEADYSLGWNTTFTEHLSQRRTDCLKRSIELDPKTYETELFNLIDRYTLKSGASTIVKVTDLNSFKSFNGIYILCLSDIRGYYIGQTSKSLTDRITRHFKSPDQGFDHRFGINDIDSVYVIPYNSKQYWTELDTEILDLIEMDCIGSIDRQYLFNILIGGHDYLLLLHNDRLSQSDLKVSKEYLEEIFEQKGINAIS